MKRHQILFGLLLSMGLGTGAVVGQTSLSVGNVPGFPGATISVPVTLRQPTGTVVAAQFDVAFNPDKVSPLTALRGERLTNHVIRSREVAPGVHRVLIYSLGNATLPGTNTTVTSVPFAVSPDEFVGSGPLTPANVLLARTDATALSPVNLSAGAIFTRPVNRRGDGIVDFFLPSVPDERYLIQATTNFVNWVNISTNVAIGSFMELVDADAPNYPFRFYRSALFDGIVGGHLGSFTRAQDGTVSFRVSGLEGRTYIIQASTNLVHWQNIHTNAAVLGLINFTDPDAPNFPQRFYRLNSGP